TKQYFVTGQFSRFVRPGSRRIEATSSHQSVRASAYIDGARLTVVAVNTSGKDVSILLKIAPHWPDGSTLIVTRTSAHEDGTELAPARVYGAKVTVTLPAASITTLASPGAPTSTAPPPRPMQAKSKRTGRRNPK